MYKVINKKNTNLIINNKTLRLDEFTYVDEDTLEKLEKLIEDGSIVVEKKKIKRIEMERKISKSEEINIQNELIEIFFKFHTSMPLNTEELNKLVWFYKNISPISNLPEHLKIDLDEARDNEELIEVLINHIYPELISNFLNR